MWQCYDKRCPENEISFEARQVKYIYKNENSDTKYTLSKESEDTIVPAELCKCYKLHTLWRRQQGRMWKYNRDP